MAIVNANSIRKRIAGLEEGLGRKMSGLGRKMSRYLVSLGLLGLAVALAEMPCAPRRSPHAICRAGKRLVSSSGHDEMVG